MQQFEGGGQGVHIDCIPRFPRDKLVHNVISIREPNQSQTRKNAFCDKRTKVPSVLSGRAAFAVCVHKTANEWNGIISEKMEPRVPKRVNEFGVQYSTWNRKGHVYRARQFASGYRRFQDR